MKLHLFAILFIFCVSFGFLHCAVQEAETVSEDNDNLGLAIAFKQNECGNWPNYPLYIASGNAKPAQKDVQICALTVVQQECPFDEYPWYCLRIFKNFKFDLSDG
ncbi:MAG: hypothetical protein AAF518_13670 [Spirochaetota bacterium]